MTENKKKALWQAQILEYLHNCLIGVSNLECSNKDCSLVLNWNDLETKQSYKGESAFYKLSPNNWVALDLIKYETNDLGTYDNIEIKFKSGKIMRTKPKSLAKENKNVFSSGWLGKKEETKEIFLKEEEVILFFNNQKHSANLTNIEEIYLNDLWEIKEQIKWDRDKSKKKVFLHVENEPNPDTEASKIDAANKDYIFYIADPSITNEIKKMEIYSPSKGTEERTRLYQDLKEDFSEMRRVYGIRHLTSKKEDRQNNPEIELNEAQFIALERDKRRERWKSIKDFENKGGCLGTHTLIYGNSPEQIQEKVQEIKEIKELEEDKENSETENVEPVEPNK